MRLGGAGPDDFTRALQCGVVFGGGVLWGLLKLPPHCLCFLISLRVRLWVGLWERVRLWGCGDGWFDGVGVGVDRCSPVAAIGGGSYGAQVRGF